MKNYKKKGMLLVSITVVFLLTIVFFYLLVSIKLWTYNSVSILNIDDDDVITVFTTLDLELFEDNNFFYYDTLKYNYKINSKDNFEEGVILTLELEESFKLVNDDMIILLPNKRVMILSLIIDSWRVK